MEVYQSLEIIKKCMDGLPEGPIMHEPKPAKLLNILKDADGWGSRPLRLQGAMTHTSLG